MARVHKRVAKAKRTKRTTRATRKLKARSRPQRKAPRKPKKQGLVDKMKSAVQTVADVAQESAEYGRRWQVAAVFPTVEAKHFRRSSRVQIR
jgi:hypothetical protein